MRRSVPILCILGVAVGLSTSACATSPEGAQTAKASKRDGCFFADQVRGYQVVDDKTLNIDVGRKEAYQLTLFNNAFDLDVSTRIGIRSNGGSWVCSPFDASVVVPEVTGSSRSYRVQAMRKLTPEEYEKAWPSIKRKPKS